MIKITVWVEPEHNEVREVEYDYNQAPTQIPEDKNIVRWLRNATRCIRRGRNRIGNLTAVAPYGSPEKRLNYTFPNRHGLAFGARHYEPHPPYERRPPSDPIHSSVREVARKMATELEAKGHYIEPEYDGGRK